MKKKRFIVTNSQIENVTYDTSGDSSEINNIDKNSNLKNYSNRNNNTGINVQINHVISLIFKKILEEEGINLDKPRKCIEVIYQYIPDENKYKNITEWKFRIETFLKTFIYFLNNVKIPAVARTFGIDENIINDLVLKQYFKEKYLNNLSASVEIYKQRFNSQLRNYKIIYTIIKDLEYKHGKIIIGLKDYIDSDKNTACSINIKYQWYIRFIVYIIVYYLNNNSIMNFKNFFNKLDLDKITNNFDLETDFDIHNLYFLDKDSFCENIISIVENVIINLVQYLK